jgi:microcystin-dependent protein
VFAHAGAGYGLLNYAFGSWWGNENVALGINNMPTHAHSFSVPAHTHTGAPTGNSVIGGGGGFSSAYGNAGSTGSAGGASGNTSAAGSGEAHFNIQPTTYLNVMIKL